MPCWQIVKGPARSNSKDGKIKFVYKGQDWTHIPKNVTHVRIDPTMKRIKDNAFSRCTQLVEVELHDCLEFIGDSAFSDSVNLGRIHYKVGNTDKGGISPSVRRIGREAFLCCKKLVELELREGLQGAIKFGTFSGCESLVSINVPSTVKCIESLAFEDCKQLVDIRLNEGLEEIYFDAFVCCTSLKHIIIPNSVKDVPTFSHCDQLEVTRKETATAERTEVSGVVEGGRWVRISGLKSAGGKLLNGKVGQVLSEESTADDRYQIKIDGDTSKGKLIKGLNFVYITRDEMVKAIRIAAKGERVNAEHKVLLFPRDHSMFKDFSPTGNVPVMLLAGLPLVVQKTKPYSALQPFGELDNPRATQLMIEPQTGFAPYEWMDDVGPVLVFRPGGLDLSWDDMVVINTYIYVLIDQYSVGPENMPVIVNSWLNRDGFQRIVQQERENGFTDLNI